MNLKSRSIQFVIFGVYLALLLCGSVAADPSPLWPPYWPQFRGPTGQGHASDTDVPIVFSEEENIVWKTKIPGSGWSSPVVAGFHVWLTTATEEGQSLRAIRVDRRTGQVDRDIEVFRRGEAERIHNQNSHATPTPIIVNSHVYVHFGRNGTACLTPDGEIVWRNQELKYTTPHGSANSPVVHDNLLIVCSDGEDKQFVTALDRFKGNIVWQHNRNHLEDAHRKSREEKDEGRKGLPFIAFSTPLVINVNGVDLLISTPADHVVANRVDTGEEVWWMPYNCFSLVARPVYGNGLVYVIGGLRDGHYAIYAINPKAKGRVTDTDIAWTRTETIPQVPSPILLGERLLLIKDSGIATCLNALDGTEIWQHRLGGNYRASPVVVGTTVYAMSQKGTCHVFKLNSPFTHLAKNKLDGIFLASPAVADNSLFFRSDEYLYRIDSGETTDRKQE